MDNCENGAADFAGFHLFARCGRFVASAAPLALVALTAAWLFVGATPVRTAVLWCSLALLTACLLILGVTVAFAGSRCRRDIYRWGVHAASVTPGRAEGTVPLRLSNAYWLSARFAGAMVAVPTLLALWVTL